MGKESGLFAVSLSLQRDDHVWKHLNGNEPHAPLQRFLLSCCLSCPPAPLQTILLSPDHTLYGYLCQRPNNYCDGFSGQLKSSFSVPRLLEKTGEGDSLWASPRFSDDPAQCGQARGAANRCHMSQKVRGAAVGGSSPVKEVMVIIKEPLQC